MGWCKTFGTAIDVGAHVGLHSFYLAQKFATVHAFEPVAEHRECFTGNVTAPNVTLYACALGDHDGSISIHTKEGSSGDSWIDGDGDIPLKRLDDFNLSDVSYIKLDCEGGELGALRGGEQMILRCRPTIMCEQKPRVLGERGISGTPALDYLRSLGMVLRQELSGDFILSFD